MKYGFNVFCKKKNCWNHLHRGLSTQTAADAKVRTACLFLSLVASHLSVAVWYLCTDVNVLFLKCPYKLHAVIPGNERRSRKPFNKHRWGISRWRHVNRPNATRGFQSLKGDRSGAIHFFVPFLQATQWRISRNCFAAHQNSLCYFSAHYRLVTVGMHV